MKKNIMDVLEVESDYTFVPPDDLKVGTVVALTMPYIKIRGKGRKVTKFLVRHMKFMPKIGTKVSYSVEKGAIYKAAFAMMAEPKMSFNDQEDKILKTAEIIKAINAMEGE